MPIAHPYLIIYVLPTCLLMSALHAKPSHHDYPNSCARPHMYTLLCLFVPIIIFFCKSETGKYMHPEEKGSCWYYLLADIILLISISCIHPVGWSGTKHYFAKVIIILQKALNKDFFRVTFCSDIMCNMISKFKNLCTPRSSSFKPLKSCYMYNKS